MTDTAELKRLIAESGIKIEKVCTLLNISYPTLSNKLNNRTEFTASEMRKIKKILNLSDEKALQIFFGDDVD